jgi:peptide/nickel transport system ATP-binding protein
VPERVLEVSGLRYVYPGRRSHPDRVAVDDVSFSLEAGGSLAIVGGSGAGKTTVVRIVAGLQRASAGRVVVLGRERAAGRVGFSERRRRARELQLVFQDPYTSLDPLRTVRDEVGAVLDLHAHPSRRDRERLVAGLLDQVGLTDRHLDLRPGVLSGGERQRVALARALAAQPRVLLLDEPVASLDVSIQAQILNLLLDLRQTTGVGYVLVSHDLGVVRQVCDHAIVMHAGRVVERGPCAQLLDRPQHPYTRLLLRSVPRPGWTPQRLEPAADGALADTTG